MKSLSLALVGLCKKYAYMLVDLSSSVVKYQFVLINYYSLLEKQITTEPEARRLGLLAFRDRPNTSRSIKNTFCEKWTIESQRVLHIPSVCWIGTMHGQTRRISISLSGLRCPKKSQARNMLKVLLGIFC